MAALYPLITQQMPLQTHTQPIDSPHYANFSPSDLSPQDERQSRKRRGPKPDSKPATSQRQERNRQAQRTHRERKEQYIKALEIEILRFKEDFGKTSRKRDHVASENKRMREMLKAHGIFVDFEHQSHYKPKTSAAGTALSGRPLAGTDDPRRQGSDASIRTPPSLTTQSTLSAEEPLSPTRFQYGQTANFVVQNPASNLDLDQIGIDFVLGLEEPCRTHRKYLLDRSLNPDGPVHHHPMEQADDHLHTHPSGHALMLSCPPFSHVMERPSEDYEVETATCKSHLRKLIELASTLPEMDDGELTPVQTWIKLMNDPRHVLMIQEDFKMIQQLCSMHYRCFGFGTVIEAFEVEDAITKVLANRDARLAMNAATGTHPLMYQQYKHQQIMV